jgi:hypothetical protein
MVLGGLTSERELLQYAKQKLLGGNFYQLSRMPEDLRLNASVAILASQHCLSIHPQVSFLSKYRRRTDIQSFTKVSPCI